MKHELKGHYIDAQIWAELLAKTEKKKERKRGKKPHMQSKWEFGAEDMK